MSWLASHDVYGDDIKSRDQTPQNCKWIPWAVYCIDRELSNNCSDVLILPLSNNRISNEHLILHGMSSNIRQAGKLWNETDVRMGDACPSGLSLQMVLHGWMWVTALSLRCRTGFWTWKALDETLFLSWSSLFTYLSFVTLTKYLLATNNSSILPYYKYSREDMSFSVLWRTPMKLG